MFFFLELPSKRQADHTEILHILWASFKQLWVKKLPSQIRSRSYDATKGTEYDHFFNVTVFSAAYLVVIDGNPELNTWICPRPHLTYDIISEPFEDHSRSLTLAEPVHKYIGKMGPFVGLLRSGNQTLGSFCVYLFTGHFHRFRCQPGPSSAQFALRRFYPVWVPWCPSGMLYITSILSSYQNNMSFLLWIERGTRRWRFTLDAIS